MGKLTQSNFSDSLIHHLLANFTMNRQFSIEPLALTVLIVSISSAHAIDLNSNGINDVFEALHPEISLTDPTLDRDGDGVTNFSEAQALTDPTDPADCFKCLPLSETAASYIIRWPSKEGLRYQAQHSTNGLDWDFVGSVFTGTGAVLTSTVGKADLAESEGNFFRARVTSEVDTDGDSIADWAETALGFSATDANSVRSAANGGDAQHLTNLLTGSNPSGGLAGTATPGTPSPENASRFLAQATFGPTFESISALQNLGSNAYEKWIDAQIDLPPSYLRPYVDFLNDRKESDYAAFLATGQEFPWHARNTADAQRVHKRNAYTAWMRTAVNADDQLRMRVAFALSQILVAGTDALGFGLGLADYYDLMVEQAFGNYEDLLFDVTMHPIMGQYLSSAGNRKADTLLGRVPDENYAREVMQLFSIGLWELNMDGTQKLDSSGEPIPTYDIEDIQEMARVFTGLWYDQTNGFGVFAGPPIDLSGRAIPMILFETEHDTNEKNLLGRLTLPSYNPFGSGNTRTGVQDIEETLNMLFNHESCAPFISNQLIKFLVTSNPSPEYVERIANIFANDGTGIRGNLGAVTKAILLDPEARNSLPDLSRPEAGKLREPLIRTTMLARAANASGDATALYDETGIQFWSPANFDDFLQYPLEPPSVINYYAAGYSRPGVIRNSGLVSPVFQILNSATAISSLNLLFDYANPRIGFHNRTLGNTPPFKVNYDNFPTENDLLLDRLNLIYANGRISADSRQTIKAALNITPAALVHQNATSVFIAAPEAAILK